MVEQPRLKRLRRLLLVTEEIGLRLPLLAVFARVAIKCVVGKGIDPEKLAAELRKAPKYVPIPGYARALAADGNCPVPVLFATGEK
jgi:hypothetical protein